MAEKKVKKGKGVVSADGTYEEDVDKIPSNETPNAYAKKLADEANRVKGKHTKTK